MRKQILLFPILGALIISGCAGSKGRSSYSWKKGPDWSVSGQTNLKRVPTGDVKLVMNEKVETWINYFTGSGRERFGRYLQRSGRYMPVMKNILRDNGLPEDVVHIALIESGFTARARSTASAVGFWQFIRGTGSHYGLKIDPYVDERQDFIKATKAAARYLSDLYNEFGDWYLAFAAYNSGEGKVRSAIRMYGTKDFWKMTTRKQKYFKPETKDYVPKFIAATMIAKNPKKYGFNNVDYQEPIDYDYAKISHQADVEAIAKCAKTDVETIETLNPELVMGVTPPGERNYVLRVPKGKTDSFHKTFARLPSDQRVTRDVYVMKEHDSKHHRVKRGETVGKIAKRYGVSTKSLMKVNKLRNNKGLKVGQRLVIPGTSSPVKVAKGKKSVDTYAESAVETASSSGAAGTEVATAGSESEAAEPVSYKVKKGDTVFTISKRFNVHPNDLRKWNNIKGNKIVAGKSLKIYKGGVPEVGALAGTSAELSPIETVIREKTVMSKEPKPISESSDRMELASADLNTVSPSDPEASSVEITAPTKSAKPKTVAVSKAASSSNSHLRYKVKNGDTAWSIAKRHSVTVADIVSWNSGKNIKKIKPGDILTLKTR